MLSSVLPIHLFSRGCGEVVTDSTRQVGPATSSLCVSASLIWFDSPWKWELGVPSICWLRLFAQINGSPSHLDRYSADGVTPSKLFCMEWMGQASGLCQMVWFCCGSSLLCQWQGPPAWRRIRPSHLRSRPCPREPNPVLDPINKGEKGRQHPISFSLEKFLLLLLFFLNM